MGHLGVVYASIDLLPFCCWLTFLIIFQIGENNNIDLLLDVRFWFLKWYCLGAIGSFDVWFFYLSSPFYPGPCYLKLN